MGVHWRTDVGAMTRLRVEKYGRKYLLELARAVGVRECVGARLLEHRHVQVTMKSVGVTYSSWRWQL